MKLPIMTVQIRLEQDVVAARRRARQIAEQLRLDRQDRTRFATSVSEIARNAFIYGGGGRIDFELEQEGKRQMLIARVVDHGNGIPHLDVILSGTYHSPTGMGLGIIGSKRLMDRFEIESAPGKGTTVTLGKLLPQGAPLISPPMLAPLLDELARETPGAPFEELQQQNQDLLRALEELRLRHEELERLNNELEDTNRGVVALYAELDEKAEHLRRADELKSKFLSNMSHEFRTPLNSIMALTRLLLDRVDGDLSSEQLKQITFIRQGTQSLVELVNDLLDIAKVESGKIDVHVVEFTVSDLFGALRGMLRPLLVNESVNLHFESNPVPLVISDEGKVAQILRNLISNALKFTEQGEVRVSARYISENDTVVFSVIDTGIGVPPEYQESIFQEFTQIENKLQSRVKGTGLGLPLSKRLAELLEGTITLESKVGVGSTFSLIIPRQSSAQKERGRGEKPASFPQPNRRKILMIDDEEVSHYLIEQNLPQFEYDLVAVTEGSVGIRHAAVERPDLILLDLVMPEMSGFDVLEALRAAPETNKIPIVVYTSKKLAPEEEKWIITHASGILMKDAMSRETLRSTFDRILGNPPDSPTS